MRKTLLVLFLLVPFFHQAWAIESSNEGDREKRNLGCQVAYKLSLGQMTPGQMTAEQSISYNYLKSYYPDEYRNCEGRREETVRRPSTSAETHPYQGIVSHVVDESTIALTSGQKISLLGVKILEGKAPEAKAYLAQSLKGHTVRIAYDQERQDRFGKLQGYLFLGDEFVNRRLIDEGLAEAHVVPPNTAYKHLLTKTETPEASPVPDEDPYIKEMATRIGTQFYFVWGSMLAALVVSLIVRKIIKR